MLKHIFLVIVAALMTLGTAGSASATFADLELIRVYYDRSGNEYGTDLGKVMDLTAGGTTTIAGTFGSLSAGTADSPSSYAVYFALDRATGKLWASNSTATAPLINGTSFGIYTLKSGTTNMYSLYNSMGGTTYSGSISAANSYKNKISATQGNLANAINNTYRMGTEASLAGVIGSGNGSVSQILYYWPNGNTTVVPEKVGTPVAFITTKADGSTVISPPPPSAPTGITVEAGDAQAIVEFSAPASDGGTAVTGYTVTSDPDGVTASGTASPITVTGLTNGTAYTFKVAATNANGTGPAGVSASITPVAGVKYAVTYYGNQYTGGSVPTDAGSPYDSGATVTVAGAGTLERTGYTFNGWNTSADGSGTSYAAGATFAIAAETRLYAQWAISSYTVTYNGNNNTDGSAPSDGTYSYGATVTVPGAETLSRSGYTFSGWNTAANGSGTSHPPGETFTIAADTTLYAQWTVNGYTVTCDGNNATGGTPPSGGTYSYGATVTVPGAGSLARTGYTFNGWNTAADGSGTSYLPGATFAIAADTTLYAQWAINNYTVAYNGNDNTGGAAPSGATYTYGATVTVADPGTLERTGYTFNGWNSAADGSGTSYPAGGTFTVASDTTLYAQWAIETYTVTPSVGMGTGYGSITPDTPQTADHGGTLTFTLTSDPMYVATVSGTCGGTLTGNSYTTDPIVGDCTVIANFSKNNYYVTASAGANGSASPASQLAAEGARVQVSITPNLGYNIASVGGSCGGTLAGNTFITAPVTASCTVEPAFSIKTSTVTASVTGGNGTVTLASGTVDYGGTEVATITPNAGYHLATLTDNGTNIITSVSGGSYTITGVTTDHTIIATFAVNTRTVTTSIASGKGSITPQSSTVNEGGSTTLTIAPGTGYHLAGVTDNGVDVTPQASAGSYTIGAISTDHLVTATFAVDTKTVTATVGAGSGTITPGNSTVNYGSTLTLTVTPAANCRLVTLTDNGSDVTDSVSGGSYTITGVTTDHVLNATFALATHTVTATVSGGAGAVTPGSSTVNHGEPVTLTITPAANYHLATLIDNGADVTAAISGGSYTITATENHSVAASFAIDTRTVTAQVSGGNGSVTPANSVINYGGNLAIAVTPAAGYHLERLTDNGTDVTGSVSNGSYTIVGVTENHSVTAIFRGITFTVTPLAVTNGGITPAVEQTVDAGKTFSFSVTPSPGYQIAGVTGCGGTLSGNTFTTAGMSANCAVSATFVAIPSLKGDLDGDGQIGIADALLALQHAAGLKPRTPAALAAGDVAPIVGGASAPDGKLDIGDAVALLRRSVGQLSW